MKDRFLHLWQRIGAHSDPETVYRVIENHYGEPHRHYHSLEHVQFCLTQHDQIVHLSESPYALEYALWYHDVIYDPHAKDNERQSAAIARHVCLHAGLPTDFADTVDSLILATRHNTPLSTTDQKLITDIDLAIFAAPAAQFDLYEANIRKEYAFVPPEQYVRARTEILQSFLDRPTIYATPHFTAGYEAKARQNLLRSLQKLQLD